MVKLWDDLPELEKISILTAINYPAHRFRGVVKGKFAQFHEELKTKIIKQLAKEEN